MPLSTQWNFGEKSPHPYAPYRSSDRTDATPRNAVFVAHHARLEDATQLTDGKQHNRLDYGMTKYFATGFGGDTLSNETGSYQYGDQPSYQREKRGDWRFSVDKFERLLTDAAAGVEAANGRVIPEALFADGFKTIKFLDSIKGNELLVQTMTDGKLTTKVIDEADLDPALARTFDKLDVYEQS
ncbi:MAG: hypothetical protein JWL76_509 [Thermoleophilia bacterium]|nr:hypothetical protein [Thermoleophilia bacterium]